MTSLRTLLAAAAAAALLAACGGGGSGVDVPAPGEVVPDSANASAAGMVRWLQALAAEDDADAKEPVDAARFAPPRPDDTEPLALR